MNEYKGSVDSLGVAFQCSVVEDVEAAFVLQVEVDVRHGEQQIDQLATIDAFVVRSGRDERTLAKMIE